jgi:hypothetical protein
LGKEPPTSPRPRTSDPDCPGLPLWPVTPPPEYLCLRTFIFPLILSWESGGRLGLPPCMAGSFRCTQVPFYGLPQLWWVFTTMPRDSSQIGWCPCAQTYFSLPPLVEVRLGCACGSRRPMLVLNPARSTLAAPACSCSRVYFPFYLLLRKWQQVTVTTV